MRVLTVLFAMGAWLGGVAVLPGAEAASRTDRPNVVLIMADDLGYECLTANGGESYQTPHLDRLAASGMRFEQCHVQPLCTPTRVQLMTGKYNVRNYLRFGVLPRDETTFAHVFQQAGYATGICGKWQLGKEADSPQHFGFDEAYLWQHTRRPPRYANPGLEHNARELDFTNGEYGPKLVNDFALDFVTRHRDQPFFLYYPMILTHSPFQPTPDSPDWDLAARGEDVNKDVRHFAAMVAYMDKMVGRLDAKLGELGIRDNTLLVFLGDNGTLGTVTSRFRGGDYRGGKGQTTARGTHVPLVVSWPSVIREASVCEDPVSSVDLFPTICAAAGVKTPESLDGVSFLPRLRGEPGQPRDGLYGWYSPRQQSDMTVKEYAFDQKGKLYRTGEYFDLVADPFEQQPLDPVTLSGEAVKRVQKLEAVLEQFREARPKELDETFRAANPSAAPTAKKKKKKAA
jgi:arylsulfatase A